MARISERLGTPNRYRAVPGITTVRAAIGEKVMNVKAVPARPQGSSGSTSRLHETKGRPPTSGAQVRSVNVASAFVVPALACGSPTML
jgi:hypothetical protein